MIPSGKLTAREVDLAREAIRPFLPPTRVIEARGAGSRRIFLKLETDQPTGSFKVRGALSNLLRQSDTPAGFVAASAGNHGLGVAWAAQISRRPEKVTIFVPESAPSAKIEKLRLYPVDLRIVGQTFDDAERDAHVFERETGARFIHAYDDLLTAAGQGTLAGEVHEAIGDIGTLVIPVGGGGLISGNAAWLKERLKATRIVAVQPDASPALSESIRLGKALLEYPAGPTIADGLSGGIGRLVFDHRALIDEVMNVPEALIRAAVSSLHHAEGVRAEASGAITVGALNLEKSHDWPQPIVCVISGGNIDQSLFEELIG
ncbi:MAG: pyridoxal-phosphate dependent enzyme [Vicinamibacteria bacterium]|nr:pyridoxal-phosphate dependent enzyme [Vicinamibacteria bacterium]